MKLSLEELKVDSYAEQIGEAELSEVKGGTTMLCAQLGISLATTICSVWKNSGSGSGGNSGSGAIIFDPDSIRTSSGGAYHYSDSVVVR